MVREIVNDGDPGYRALFLETALDTPESGKAVRQFRECQPLLPRGTDGRQGVVHVVRARQPGSCMEENSPLFGHIEFCPLPAEANVLCFEHRGPVKDGPAAGRCFHGVRNGLITAVCHDESGGGNEVHDSSEGFDDGRQVRVEIGMIELDRRDDKCLRGVVQEFWALVIVRGGVLVPLDDKYRAFPHGAWTRKVNRLAADEVSGGLPRVCKQPRRESRCRGFPVCPRHNDGVPVTQELIVKGARHGLDVKTQPECLQKFRVVPPGEVSDNGVVDSGLDVLRVEPTQNVDSQGFEPVRHRGVEWQEIRPLHNLAALHEKRCEGGHRGSADGYEEEFPGGFVHAARSLLCERETVNVSKWPVDGGSRKSMMRNYSRSPRAVPVEKLQEALQVIKLSAENTNLSMSTAATVLAAGVLALSHLALAQGAAPAAPAAPAAAAPKMLLTEEKKDFGTVPKGETLVHDFIIKNTGTADLQITDVKPACGCTLQSFDKVIKPGSEGKVHLAVDTKSFQGPISKTALILTNDPSTPQVTVFMMANVKPYVEVLPFGFFRMQGIAGEEITSELTLVSDEPSFKPGKIDVPAPYMKATATQVPEKELMAGKGKNQWKVRLVASKEAPVGIPQGVVRVETGVAKQPELFINVSGSITDSVGVIPAQVTFGTVELKENITKEVDVINRNSKNSEFKVMGVVSSVAGVHAEVKPVDKARVRLVLSLDPKTIKKGPFDGSLTIQTNDATKKEIKIGVKGTVL